MRNILYRVTNLKQDILMFRTIHIKSTDSKRLEKFRNILKRDDVEALDATEYSWRIIHMFMAAKAGAKQTVQRLIELGIPVTDATINVATDYERIQVLRLQQDSKSSFSKKSQ